MTDRASPQQRELFTTDPNRSYYGIDLGDPLAPAAVPQQRVEPGPIARLPLTPVNVEQARAAVEEFRQNRIALAESSIRGAQANLEQTRKEYQEWRYDFFDLRTYTPARIFASAFKGYDDALNTQKKAEEAYINATTAHLNNLNERANLANEVLLASQRLANGTDAEKEISARLLELVPALLEIPAENYQKFSDQVGVVLKGLALGKAGMPAAKGALAVSRTIAEQWMGSVDPETGQRPTVGAFRRSDVAAIRASYAEVDKMRESRTLSLNTWQMAIATATVAGVALTAGSIAAGGLVLFGGASITSASIFSGVFGGFTTLFGMGTISTAVASMLGLGAGFAVTAGLGVAIGTGVGAWASLLDMTNGYFAGKSKEELQEKFGRDMKSYFHVALWGATMAKVAQGIGGAVRGFSELSKAVVPKPIHSFFSIFSEPLLMTSPAASTAFAGTYIDGWNVQQEMDRHFIAWAKTKPGLDPAKEDFNAEKYYGEFLRFREANGISDNELLWQAAKNAIAAGFVSHSQMGATPMPDVIEDRRAWSRGMRMNNLKGLALAGAIEYGTDKVRETLNKHPRDPRRVMLPNGKSLPIEPFRGDEIDLADAQRIAFVHFWGAYMGRTTAGAFR